MKNCRLSHRPNKTRIKTCALVLLSTLIAVIATACFALLSPNAELRRASAFSDVKTELRVLDDDVWLFSSPCETSPDGKSNKLFLLRKSYYLAGYETTVDDFGEIWYTVDYQNNANGYALMVGYVKSSDVQPTNDNPSYLFPQITAEALKAVFIRDLPSDSSNISATAFSGQKLSVYGFFSDSENGANASANNYAYVKCGLHFGYVRLEQLLISDIPLHAIPLPKPVIAPVVDGNSQENGGDSDNHENASPPTADGALLDRNMQIILVFAILIPAVLIIILLIKPPRKINRDFSRYYD